jgi:hypothetical protein
MLSGADVWGPPALVTGRLTKKDYEELKAAAQARALQKKVGV